MPRFSRPSLPQVLTASAVAVLVALSWQNVAAAKEESPWHPIRWSSGAIGGVVGGAVSGLFVISIYTNTSKDIREAAKNFKESADEIQASANKIQDFASGSAKYIKESANDLKDIKKNLNENVAQIIIDKLQKA